MKHVRAYQQMVQILESSGRGGLIELGFNYTYLSCDMDYPKVSITIGDEFLSFSDVDEKEIMRSILNNGPVQYGFTDFGVEKLFIRPGKALREVLSEKFGTNNPDEVIQVLKANALADFSSPREGLMVVLEEVAQKLQEQIRANDQTVKDSIAKALASHESEVELDAPEE
jgi:hypothetical protein